MKTKKISLFLLVLLIVSAIDSIRNLPSAAIFGPSLPFFFLLSAVIFLLPVSLISAQLSSWIKDKGGVYHWIAEAFGENIGMLGIWLQWINTMVWYPTILSFMAGTLAYLIDPSLAENKAYLMVTVLTTFWLLTFINLFGLRSSTKINAICVLLGTIIPLFCLIILGGIWQFSGEQIAISFTYQEMLPNFSSMEDWTSLTAIMASFLGMELAGVHANDIENPQENFPKAMAYSFFLLIVTMLFGALSIAVVVPAKEILLVSGVMQVFSDFFAAVSLPALTPVLAFLILLGSFGSIINWLISPAKGLLHAAKCGYLPKWFVKENSYGVASNILITQAIIVSVISSAFYLVPSVNAFYWFLTALSTDLYMMMYLLLFCSAVRLYGRFYAKSGKFQIPGGKLGILCISFLGMGGCFLTIFVSFFPPSTLAISKGYYAFLIFLGNVILAFPALFFWYYRRLQTR